MGFRLQSARNTDGLVTIRFPSLSESSGFPTTKNRGESPYFFFWGFHLFQRVVGFRLLGYHKFDKEISKLFPSLSESSGFPTWKYITIDEYSKNYSFHLFQRVVGFRHLTDFLKLTDNHTEFPSLSESSGFPTMQR